MESVFYLKSCPRCHGDLVFEQDSAGRYRQCLQCGFVQDVDDAPRPKAPAVIMRWARQARAA